jgi:hypothetical protein
MYNNIIIHSTNFASADRGGSSIALSSSDMYIYKIQIGKKSTSRLTPACTSTEHVLAARWHEIERK